MIALRPITVRNWETAAVLEVAEDQIDFVRSNLWSLAEAGFHPDLRPMGIYAGGTMVGFLMWGIDPNDGQPWLYRFMIDRRHQRQGHGSRALQQLLKVVAGVGHTKLNVGYAPENIAAQSLYLLAGFQPTGTAPWGENTACFTFTQAS